VEADGSNSAVRRSLLPDAGMDTLRSVLYGKTAIARNTWEWMPESPVDTFNVLTGPAAGGWALRPGAPAGPAFRPDLPAGVGLVT
jgi:hypothetical protein